MQLSGSAALIVPADIRTYHTVGSYRLTYSPDNTTGTLFSFGQKQERRTYNYDKLSVQSIGQDYGSISNIVLFSDEYGSLLDSSTLIEDFGFVSTIDLFSAATPFGKLTVGGAANTEWINKNFYGSIFGPAAEIKVTYSPDNTTGTLFSLGQKLERRTFNYNQSSIENTESDYGLISQITAQTEDYQSIASIHGLVEEFGSISESTGGLILPFGTITLSGSAITSANYRLFFYGSSVEKFVYSPNTTGTLFGFGEKIERITYSYNKQSIFNNIDDYGLVSELTVGGFDYGSITSISGSQPPENYGSILESVVSSVSLPFGSLSFSGTSLEKETDIYIGLGTVFVSGNVSNVQEIDSYKGSGTISLSGTYNNFKYISAWVGSGILFGFGEKVERRTYVYDQNLPATVIEDFGLIINSPTTTIDCGSVNSPVNDGIENYGSLGGAIGVTPFGSLSLSGIALESESDVYIGLGTIFGSGNVSNVQETDSYKGSGTISLSGTALDSSISDYVGSGTLFGFGEKVERRTYAYNETSVESDEDYGLVSELTIGGTDYGSITGVGGGQIDDDYGLITQSNITAVPFGSLSLSGTAFESFSAQTPEDTQLFAISGSIIEKETDSYKGSGTISLSGTALDSSISDYVGSGTLFGFGEKIERRTYAYDQNLPAVPIEDFGLIINSPTTTIDCGSVNSVVNDGIENYGSLGTAGGSIPFGSLSLSGTALESESDVYIGLGTIFISGDVSNVQETDSYKGSGTISLSGTALDSSISDYVGSGTLFGFGEKIERRTYAYNEFAILDDDYGSIVNTPSTLDYGFIFESISNTTQIDNYGLITELNVIGIPFGSLSLSGTALESESDVYIGLGTIFISGDVSNVQETDSYKGSGTISLSGTALESETDSYVGLGTLTLSDFSRESEVDVYVASGSLSLSGNALESETDVYIGLGTIFISGDVSNVQETDSYVGSGTISLSGTALESETDSYVGLGTLILTGNAETEEVDSYSGQGIITISGTALESESDVYIGLGTISIFTLNVTRYYSPIYPRNALIGDPGSGIGTIRLNDDSVLTVTRATLPYKAKGGITLSNGLKESFNKGNYNSSGIVTLSGIASTREIQVYGYYGDQKNPGTSGKITLNEQTTPIIEKYTSSYVGLGTITLSDSFERKRLRAWNGSGTITLSGIGLDSITIPVSNTILFKFSGSKFESFIPTTEIGSGIITITGSSDTPIRTFVHNGSGSIVLNGSAIIRPVLRQIGTGTIRLVPRFRVDDDYTSCDNDTDFSVQFGNTPLLNATSITFDNSNITFDSQIIKSTSTLSVTCDREDDATVKFVANPPEDTILFTISGSSITSVVSLDSYVGIGNIFISGGYTNLRSTKVKVGTGIVTISQLSKDVEIDSYVGLGTILSLSGASKSKIANPPENTILVQIGGTASTRVEFEYSYVGVGTQYFSGIGSQRIVYADRGSGLISLSGNLVYPDIKFVPSPDGSGIISIVGTSKEKSTVVHNIQGGSLFTLYGGFESFSKTNYNGIGTIFIVGAASSIINNPFQPSRVYVTII